MNNILANLQNFSIRSTETFCMPCAAIGKRSGIEFNELFAHWLFILQERVYFSQYFGQHFSGNSPLELVFSSFVVVPSVNKIYSTAKPLQKPFENRSLGVIAGKNYFVNIVWFVFWFVFLNKKATLSVNEPSQVSIVFTSRLNSISQFLKLNLLILRDQVSYIFMSTYLIYQMIVCSLATEIKKHLAFLFLLNQELVDIFSHSNTGSLLDTELIQIFLIAHAFVYKANRAAKYAFKEVKYIGINRRNSNTYNILLFKSFSCSFLAKIKTAISVYIASSVCKNSTGYFFFHDYKIA